jgi:hypothetical protein
MFETAILSIDLGLLIGLLAQQHRQIGVSVAGQNRKWGDAIATSDLPLKADIKRTSRHVRKVPISEATVSLDDKVCDAKQGCRKLKAECPCGLEVEG